MQTRIIIAAPLFAVALSAGVVEAQVNFEQSTNSVLAALGVLPGTTGVVVGDDLIALIGEAMASGQSSDYIDALVMEAHTGGEITVPDSMVDAAGEVDSAAMLAAVVGAAIAAQPAEASDELIILESDFSNAEDLTATAEVADDIPNRTHQVKSGDTLLRLAETYYGSTASYRRILAANPNVRNANLIRVGMVLSIP